MEQKQTAVEWLINEIDMQYPEINVRWKEWMIDKAKEMEKQQIIKAWDDGGYSIYTESAEQYYNEEYGK